MKLHDIRQGASALWDSVTHGWERLRQTTAGALTRYRPGARADLPLPEQIEDASCLYMPDGTRSAVT